MATPTPIKLIDRAEEVAYQLLGTCLDLHDRLTDEEQENRQLLDLIDGRVMLCVECGWWEEAGDVDELGICSDCSGPEEDEDG